MRRARAPGLRRHARASVGALAGAGRVGRLMQRDAAVHALARHLVMRPSTSPGPSGASSCCRAAERPGPARRPALQRPGIQFVPASGTPAIAAASTVSATRSSRSRWWTSCLPQARAMVETSIAIVFR